MRIRSGVHFSAILSLLALLVCPTLGEIIYVDDDGVADFDTIQAAIDDANDGDFILVAPGTYTGDGNRDIDFKGKAITVASEHGPSTCIIDCQGDSAADDLPLVSRRGFHFHCAEDANSVAQGFTITNGLAAYHEKGGGILCEGASPRIVNCVVVANKARFGGGIAAVDSGVRVVDCVISHNEVAENGGGIYCVSNTRECAVFERNLIVGNHAQFHPRFGGDGGGVYLGADACFSNCTISGNWAGYKGGGLNCWLRGHEAILANSIVWGNHCERAPGAQFALVRCNESGRGIPLPSLFISHCTIGGGAGEPVVDSCAGIEGNWIDAAPLFVRAGYWDPNETPEESDDDFWVDGDYHLMSKAGRWDPNVGAWARDAVTSPCIDAGDPNSEVGDEVWPHGGRINMGAYGGTREASLSAESSDMFLPRVACIYWYNSQLAESCQSFLQAYGCSVTLIRSEDIVSHSMDDYNLILIATDTASPAVWSDPQTVATLTESGKPILGLGRGGYVFFGELGLTIGSPNGAQATLDSIHVLDSDDTPFAGPYDVAVPADRKLRLFDWPAPPETVTTFAGTVDDPGYFPLAAEQGHLLWGFAGPPETMTQAGQRLFLNAVILTANRRLE